MIFGLGAALGWGIADVMAAVSGRRIGAARTVVISQIASALLISGIVVLARPDLQSLKPVWEWLLLASFLASAAYLSLYRALVLGPIAVVSPVLASYAVIPVLLAVALLGEELGPVQVAGVVATITGAVLTSTDLRALRAGTHRMPPGLPYAVASALLFGVATYVLGWASQRAGWLPALWFARTSAAIIFVIGTLAVVLVKKVRRAPSTSRLRAKAVGFAALLSVVDLLGAFSYVLGAATGLVSIVTAASATYPLIPVFAGVVLFEERPVPNQYLGVALVVGGLILLAVG